MIVTLTNPYANKENTQKKGTICLSASLPESLTRKNILKELIRQNLISEDLKSASLITTNPRNYYYDILLSKDQELYYSQDQISSEESYNWKKIIQLPFSMEIVSIDHDWMIDCHFESITPKYFDILSKLGEGSYSQIYLVQRKYDRHLFCMKRINKAQCREKGHIDMIKNEFQILEYSSKYKIKLYYQFEDAKHVYFILDYCPFGDLFSLIKMNKKVEEQFKLTLTEKYSIWIQIVLGIASLHQKGIIYRDIKPENILIDENERVRICDFGFACKIMENQKLTSLCGSYQYLAPEMIKKQGYNKSIDLYCLGLLFYELLVGSNPFEGLTPQNVIEMKNKAISFDKKQFSSTVKDLLKKLMKQKPEERLGYDSTLNLFKHDFFKENEDLVKKIIKGENHLKNIRYVAPIVVAEREQLDVKQNFIFIQGKAYNYLKPFFDVIENIGPKFESV